MAKIELPTSPTEPAQIMSQFKFLIHGFPKVGKTTLGSLFEKPIFMATEAGYRAISVYKFDIMNWDEMAQAATLLIKETHDYKTVVIDVLERAYVFLYDQICRDNNVKRLSDIGWGGGYDEANRRMWNLLESLFRSGLGVVLLCHSRLEEYAVGGLNIKRVQPDFSDSPRKVIMPWPDITIYLGVDPNFRLEDNKDLKKKDTAPRLAYCQPLANVEAGGRIRYLPGIINLGTDPIGGYRILEEEFNKAIQRQLAELKKPEFAATKKEEKDG